jgi:hypothetical protein
MREASQRYQWVCKAKMHSALFTYEIGLQRFRGMRK